VPRRDRRADRVLLIDGGGAVLLLRGRDSTRPEAGEWWFTPGGGAEDGETPREAAARELVEETGLTGAVLSGPVHERVAEFEFEGVPFRQTETYYLARARRFDIDRSGWTDLERRSMLGARWWSADELAATRETVYPEGLGPLLRSLGG